MKNVIFDIICESLVDINDEIQSDKYISPDMKTKLFGGSGELDSLALVRFLVDIESRISDKLDLNITLSDERAMSQKRSPFRSVDSLHNYILMLVSGGRSE